MVRYPSSKANMLQIQMMHYPFLFSRKFSGKEAALYAGLERASGQYVTVMDVDLQDPPELLIEMKQRLEEQPDLDCVGTRRVTRDGGTTDSLFLCTDVL